MFLTVVAHLRYDKHRNSYCNGKIDIWPFVERTVAKRSSVNRPKGAMTTTAVNVDHDVYRRCIIGRVFSAIRERFPNGSRRIVNIQQDNARPHIKCDDLHVQAAGNDGWKMKMVNQPANSPDLNILDLGLFRSLQAIQPKKYVKEVETLVSVVRKALNEITGDTLLRNFTTLKEVMKCVLDNDGGNYFKVPHSKKLQRMRFGEDI